jgi:hypothetical protein
MEEGVMHLGAYAAVRRGGEPLGIDSIMHRGPQGKILLSRLYNTQRSWT